MRSTLRQSFTILSCASLAMVGTGELTSPLALLQGSGPGIPFVVAVVMLIVFSLGVHEAAHATVALWCGDTTARDLGRITLNPVPHIDPFMTIILPAMLAFSGAPVFGGAKPVPVRMDRLRHGMRDMAFVALAGPLSNVILAFFFGLVFALLMNFGVYSQDQLMPRILSVTVIANLVLAVFNMFPVPPLDGSRVLTWLLPRDLREPYNRMEAFGIFIIFGLIWLVPAFGELLMDGVRPLLGLVNDVSYAIANPLTDLFQ